MADRAPNKTLSMRRCTCTSTTVPAPRGRDCLVTSSFTTRSDCTSRWATARLPKFTSIRHYNENKNSKKIEKFSHLKNTSFTVLTKGSTIRRVNFGTILVSTHRPVAERSNLKGGE